MGCDGEDAPVIVFEWDGVQYYRCPNQLINQQSLEYIRWHRHYKMGHLPVQGGFLQQPHKFLQAMEVIDQAVNEYEMMLQKKMEEDRRRR